MRISLFTTTLSAGVLALAAGCSTTTETAASAPDSTGFLSTYRNLESQSAASMRYLDPTNRLGRYNKFIINPIEVRMYEASSVTPEELDDIKSYLHRAMTDALSKRYQVVTAADGETAEVRLAVTNIQKSTPILNVIPRPKLANIGLGGLSLEAEVIDSVSNVQIAALIESRTGQNRWIDFSELDDSKAVMDEWARRLVAVVNEAHRDTSGQ